MHTMSQLSVPTESRTYADFEHELQRDPHLKSAHTLRGYRRDLRCFEAWRAGRSLTKLLVEEYAAALQAQDKSPNTINRNLAAVRWWARRLGDLAFEVPDLDPERRREIVTQTARVASVKDVRGQRQLKGRHLHRGEMESLLRVCIDDPKPSGVRDAAMIALAWVTGARRSEIAGVKLADYTATNEREGELIIQGKGDKERSAYIVDGAARYLEDWLKLRGDIPGPIFCPVWKSGKIQAGRAMTTEAMAQMLSKRAAQSGLGKPITWHDFRRTFAGNLLEAGHDLVTVQKLLGHATPVTTSLYDRRGEETKRRAVRSLHVPYQRRQFW